MQRKNIWYTCGVVGLLVIVVLILVFTGGSAWATAQVGAAEVYTLRLADNPFERARGLSGWSLGALNADGMLFVFRNDAIRTFTMRGMQFPLDILWIRDNRIIKIDRNVPVPAQGTEPLSLTSDPLFVDMVIEVPSGRAATMNFQVGHTLTIDLDPEEGS